LLISGLGAERLFDFGQNFRLTVAINYSASRFVTPAPRHPGFPLSREWPVAAGL